MKERKPRSYPYFVNCKISLCYCEETQVKGRNGIKKKRNGFAAGAPFPVSLSPSRARNPLSPSPSCAVLGCIWTSEA